MPRWSSYPDTVEDSRTISISDLKKWGYLDKSNSGILNWIRFEKKVASIGLESFIQDEYKAIRLTYTVTQRHSGEKEDYDYFIRLEAVPSNLGIGYRHYFICPFTDKRCMKLYEPASASVFAHRSYWKDLYYENQIKSKSWRSVSAYFDRIKKLEELDTPYMKNFYRGKPTPRFKRWMKLARKQEVSGEAVLRSLGTI